MTTAHIITLIVVIAACVGAIILLYFMGKRNMKKRDEQQAAIDQAAQWVNMLIINPKSAPLFGFWKEETDIAHARSKVCTCKTA